MTTRADKAAALHDEITSAATKRLLELCDDHMELAQSVAHRITVRLEAFNRYHFLAGLKQDRPTTPEPTP